MRYINSFILTSIVYLISTFFLFFLFADVIIEPEKKVESSKISLNYIELTEQKEEVIEPIKTESKLIEQEPIVNNQIPIKKRIKEKKVEEKRNPKKEILEKINFPEIKNEIVQKEEIKHIEHTNKKIEDNQIDESKTLYLSKLRNLIEKNKHYPKIAKRLNQTGKVYVTFLITKEGKIKNYKISKSSNFEILDKAALDILINISNFEPIPNDLNKESWEITVPIIYQIHKA